MLANMLVSRRRVILAGLAATAACAPARADPMKVRLGLAMPGGGAELYGIALVDNVRSVDPTFEIRGLNTKGILDNIAQLEAGSIDFGLVFGEAAHEAFEGINRPPTRLRIASVMYSSPGMFAVRPDSRYRSIGDLKGHRVVFNTRGGGQALQARYVLDGLGLDMEKDFEAVYTERLQDGPRMIVDGTAAALWGGGRRWPGFVTLTASSRGARFIAPSPGEIERIRAKYSFLEELVVPAGMYQGQYDPITTIGSWGFVLARADLDDAVGFRLAQALHRLERMALATRQLSESTVKNTLMAVPKRERLQPGVLAYYKKAGLLDQ